MTTKTIRDLGGTGYDLGSMAEVTTKLGHTLTGRLAFGTTPDLLPPKAPAIKRKGNWALVMDGGYEVQLLPTDEITVRGVA